MSDDRRRVRADDQDPEAGDPRLDYAEERKTFTDAELALAKRRYEKWLERRG
jgi:hypothetical protein